MNQASFEDYLQWDHCSLSNSNGDNVFLNNIFLSILSFTDSSSLQNTKSKESFRHASEMESHEGLRNVGLSLSLITHRSHAQLKKRKLRAAAHTANVGKTLLKENFTHNQPPPIGIGFMTSYFIYVKCTQGRGWVLQQSILELQPHMVKVRIKLSQLPTKLNLKLSLAKLQATL